MTQADVIYQDLIQTIIEEGLDQSGAIRPHYADGEPAYTRSIPHFHCVFKPEDGLPILQSKRIAIKTFLRELDWIWRLQSNDVHQLQKMGCQVWNEWQLADGTIGKAYGYQLAKKCHQGTDKAPMNQVAFILDQIQHHPNSRRIMTSLYDVDDLAEMALEPCVFLTHWQVSPDGKLQLNVVQRSADCALGLPSNWFEYGVLHRRVAQVTGRDLGDLHWTIFNAHIYLRHMDQLQEQVQGHWQNLSQPELVLPSSLDFFETPLTDCQVINYDHLGNFNYEISI